MFWRFFLEQSDTTPRETKTMKRKIQSSTPRPSERGWNGYGLPARSYGTNAITPPPPTPPIPTPPILTPPILTPPIPIPPISTPHLPPSSNNVRAITTLPKGTRSLGNAKQWATIVGHLQSSGKRHKPLVIWGSTGSGKTYGVREVLAQMNYRICELDGSDAEDTHQLITWVKRMRDIKVLEKSNVVFLDDFESFTPDARKRLVEILKTSNNSHLAPIIVTCTQFKHPDMKELQQFNHVRLFTPNEHIIEKWFNVNGITRTTWNGKEWTTSCRPPKANWASTVHMREMLSFGDVRRVRIALEWAALTKHTLSVQHSVAFLNSFQATQQLLLKKTSPDKWASGAESRDVNLIREHLPKHVASGKNLLGDLEALAEVMDHLSCADIQAPQRFEQTSTQLPYTLLLAAMTTTCFSNTQGVGALHPPAFLDTSPSYTPEIRSGERPMTRMEQLELPLLLRDRE